MYCFWEEVKFLLLYLSDVSGVVTFLQDAISVEASFHARDFDDSSIYFSVAVLADAKVLQ